jgi:hypothetical protein
MEKQIITSGTVAAKLQLCLVDPRAIESIVLITTQDEPSIQGYKNANSFVLSIWASVNKNCWAVLKELPEPRIAVHIGPGFGAEACAAVAADFIKSFLERSPRDPTLCAFLQYKGVPQYPPGRNGPRSFHLITICANVKLPKHEIRQLTGDDALLPEYNAVGTQLVEFRETNAPAPGSAQSSSTISSVATTGQSFASASGRTWWQFWK